jgi:hypothetical protein
MVLKGIMQFFNPKTGQQVQVKQQQTKRQGQQQQTKQQVQQQQVVDFIPQGKMEMPPLRQTSSLFQQAQQKQQQLTTADQLSDAIVQQVNKQTQQSRQQLAQAKKQQVDKQKLEQAQLAHEQILGYARQIRSLLSQINEMRQINKIRQQQTQQNKRKIKKAETDATSIVAELRSLLDQMATARQQTRRTQQSHIRQLENLKTTLIAQAEGLKPASNKKVVQYDTPDGNKVRIQLAVRPDSKCCVAQSLAQKTRVNLRPVQKTIFI